MSLDENKFNELMHDYWEFNLHEFPTLATFTGDNRNNDKINGYSKADFERRKKSLLSFKDRLQSINTDGLSDFNKTNLDILQRTIDKDICTIKFNTVAMSISKIMNFTAGYLNPSR